jgi:hypothetical protein
MTHTETRPPASSPLRRTFGACLLAASLCLALLLSFSTPARAAGPECPNEARRAEQGEAALAMPDCRAYEVVTPPGVQPFVYFFGNLANIQGGVEVPGEDIGAVASRSSLDSGIAFFSTFAPSGSLTDGPTFLSSRGSAAWSTLNPIPPTGATTTIGCQPYMNAWSADLERGIFATGYDAFGTGVPCPSAEPPLVPDEPRGVQNLFLRDTATGSFQLIDQPGLVAEPANAVYQGGSSDLGLVAFSEGTFAGAAGSERQTFFVWAGGTTDRPLTILPDGRPTEGSIPDPATPDVPDDLSVAAPVFDHAVAPDGSRIEFLAGGNLYSRLNPAASEESTFDEETGACAEPAKACTVQIDASETAEPGGGGVFASSSGVDGSVVYFTDITKLTDDSTAAAGEPDLYAYDFADPVGERLTDLTVDHEPGEHADVLGVVGTNETGAPGNYVYFVATGRLAADPNTTGDTARSGAPNLYMAHEGSIGFVATLNEARGGLGDSCAWEKLWYHCSRISSDGRYLGFNSTERLTGFDNAGPCHGAENQPAPCQEIFLYDGRDGDLTCASCGATGSLPVAPASIRLAESMAASVNAPISGNLQRYVSDTGQVFFDTSNPLLPAARSGQNLYTQSNVYEYEDGSLSLLSGGGGESYFYDASADGRDVYLVSQQPLVPGARSAEFALYDAKAEGGLLEPPTPPQCEGESCRGPATQPSPASSPATPGFSGPEEGPKKAPATPCRKGFVKKGNKCVKKPSRQKHHKSRNKPHTNKKNGKEAGGNRRAGK